MDIDDPLQWKYRAEGNKHIVVSNEKGQVLRLSKYYSDTYNGDLKPKLDGGSVAEVLSFQACVALPLMRYSDACHLSKEVQLSSEFVNALHEKIQPYRPEARKHKDLKETRSALLMFDHCFLPAQVLKQLKPSNGLLLYQDTFSVEIKPKAGFLFSSQNNNNSGDVCQFCCTQLYRAKHEKDFLESSLYCPLDLFSGSRRRMRKSVSALLHTPQNNFRIFKNGRLEYSQEIIESRKNGLETCAAASTLKALLSNFISTSNSDTKFVDTFSAFVDLICEGLLLPVVEKQKGPGFKFAPQNCCGNVVKKRSLNLVNGYFDKKSELEEEATLPEDCILGLVLLAQTLNTQDIEKVLECYNTVLKSDVLGQNGQSSKLDAPYSSDKWKSSLQRNCKITPATVVRQFLASKSFSDCSIMLSMQKLPTTQVNAKYWGESKPTALCNVINDRRGNPFLVSLAIVDMDPKYSSKIPNYYRQCRQLSEWWKTLSI